MQPWPVEKTLYAYVSTMPLLQLGPNSLAYGLLFRTPTHESWHWGVKNNEDQWIDMEMFGLRRVLEAMSNQDLGRDFRLKVFTLGAYLAARLQMAAKWKRDIDQGIEIAVKRNQEAWIETSILWDVYGLGAREAQTVDEKNSLELALRNLRSLDQKILSPLNTHVAFVESPEEIEIFGHGFAAVP